MDLSFVIPCFNEERRVGACLAAVCAQGDRLPGTSWEAVVVDDGSTDATADVVRAVAATRPEVRLLALGANAGKGEAVRRGVLEAAGDVIVVLDADLAVDVGHVDEVLPALRDGVDVAVGCRNVRGARVERRQAGLRRALGRGYLNLAKWLLGLRVSDVTCGFKGFRRAVARRLFERVACRRWGFDAEVLHLAARERYVVREVPVVWRDGADSKVRLPRDAVRSLRELLAVRWRSLTGGYGRAPDRGVRGPR